MSIDQSISLLPPRLRPKESPLAGPALMLSSAFVFAVMDCLIKVLASSSFRVWDIAFYRFGFGIVILLLVFPSRGNPFKAHNLKQLILRGVSGSVAFLALIWAFQVLPISTAMVLFYAYPAFATLFSAWFFKEESARGGLFWSFTAFLGVAVFFDSTLEGGILGQAVCLIAAAFAGLAVSSVKKARETDGSVIIYQYFCLTGAAISFAPFVLDPHIPASGYEWIILAGIVAGSAIAQLLMNEGFRYCGSCEGSLLLTCEMIFVALWGFIFLKEAVTWHFWVGGTIILGSIVAMSLLKGPAAPAAAALPRMKAPL
jgi:drug/metabolite transporter (DMT)-like permease